MAARIGAAPHTRQFLVDQRVGGRFDERNHETGERIARGHEGACVTTVGARVEAARAGAAAEHAIDFRNGVVAHAFGEVALFGEYTERRAHPPRVDHRGRGCSRLENGTASNPGGAFIVDGSVLLKPEEEGLEVPQQIAPGHLRGGVGVDEVKPESRARGHGSGWTIAGVDPSRVGEGDWHIVESEELGYLHTWLRASASYQPHLFSAAIRPNMSFPFARVAVGSRNPVKLAAVRAVLERVQPALQLEGVEVASGVPDQPMGDEETQRGARNRAMAALQLTGAELAVGLEGGVVALADGRMRSCAWAVVVDRDGREGMGGSLSMPLPDLVSARIRAGEELGHAMDAIAHAVDTKHGRGAVGILTAGLIDRQRAYEPMVAYALAPWLAPALFAPTQSANDQDGR